MFAWCELYYLCGNNVLLSQNSSAFKLLFSSISNDVIYANAKKKRLLLKISIFILSEKYL